LLGYNGTIDVPL